MVTHSLKREAWPFFVAIVAGIAWFVGMPFVGDIMDKYRESRTYRDAANLTPFADVQIFRTTTGEFGTNVIAVEGVFRKVRCEKVSDSVWTRGPDGILYAAVLDVSLEAAGTPSNRPPSKSLAYFGPWLIYSLIPDPASALFFATHECPEGRTTNLVFELPWETTKDPHPIEVFGTEEPA